jgi:hypothetical protein
VTKKKIVFFGMMAALLVFAFSVTGCPTDASEDPASMTFVQTTLMGGHNVPIRQFTINEHQQFSVRFLVEVPAGGGVPSPIPAGTTIGGRVTEASSVWDQTLTGVSTGKSTTLPWLDDVLGAVNAAGLSVTLTYTPDVGNITGVTVSFAPPPPTGNPAVDAANNALAANANGMMGGTFTRQ